MRLFSFFTWRLDWRGMTFQDDVLHQPRAQKAPIPQRSRGVSCHVQQIGFG